MADLIAWEADYIVLAAPRTGAEARDPAEPTDTAACLGCRGAVTFRLSSYAAARDHPLRLGRPVGFLCVECAVIRVPPDVLVDLRKIRNSG